MTRIDHIDVGIGAGAARRGIGEPLAVMAPGIDLVAALAVGEAMFWYRRMRGMQRRIAQEAEAADDRIPGAK